VGDQYVVEFSCDENIIIDRRGSTCIHFHYQVVPHITDEIQDWIERVAMIPVDGKEGPPDVCVIELGGTIGEDNNSIIG